MSYTSKLIFFPTRRNNCGITMNFIWEVHRNHLIFKKNEVPEEKTQDLSKRIGFAPKLTQNLILFRQLPTSSCRARYGRIRGSVA